MVTFRDRLRHAWNVFTAKDPFSYRDVGSSSSVRNDIKRFTKANKQSIMSAALTKIAIDCSGIEIKHCRVDENGRYKETINSSLNDIFNLEANKDQTGIDFIQDIVTTMLDEGSVAIVPIETDNDLFANGAFGISKMRVGRIREWFPDYVRIDIYNDITGRHQDITMPKSKVGIVQNPLYAVMNEPNSTLQRLIRKLNLLDYIDEQSGSGKLNLIFQLPYSIRSEYHKAQAAERKETLERQLQDSKYGIGYIDATEKITQLNRPVDNNLLDQIKYLTEMFYSQIGMTKSVFDGTANEAEMLNYYSRSIEPIMSAIVSELKRKFLTKTARSQNQSILFFRNPFKLVPVDKLADIADRFLRNEILSPNEMRAVVGYKPVDDERADQLRNPNINEEVGALPPPSTSDEALSPEEEEAYQQQIAIEKQERLQSLLQTPMSSIKQ